MLLITLQFHPNVTEPLPIHELHYAPLATATKCYLWRSVLKDQTIVGNGANARALMNHKEQFPSALATPLRLVPDGSASMFTARCR